MATYFGEVLPEFSRATDDDDEELENETVSTNSRDEWEVIVRWSSALRKEIELSPTNTINCNLLIFAIGPVACGFVQKHRAGNEKPVGVLICGLSETDRNTISQQEVDDSSCFVHHINAGSTSALAVLWHHQASEMQQFSLTKKVFKYLPKENFKVVILTSTHVSEFRASDKEALIVPFLRSLVTDVEEESMAAPKLEIPNTVVGLPAHVLAYCQLYNIPASLYIGYTEVMSTDSLNIQVFQPLLSVSKLGVFLRNTVGDPKLISSLHMHHGNLYL